MTSLALQSLRFELTAHFPFHIIQSWWEHKHFANFQEAQVFFDENKAMIQAQPFIKWV